ncbi:MAG: glutamate--tRNA ligase [Clostridiales bacterium]|nr:glutamate--tRNA ligase [Clostridiales bacterium]
MVRTRFAPSPTGYLHIGGLRTALYAYLYAKKHGGRFILRIEDTDQNREVEGAVDVIIKALEKAGMHYDEGPIVGGDCGPYIQSQRKDIYLKYAHQLIESGDAYYCFCSKERLEDLHKNGATKYDKHCLHLSKKEIEKRIKDGEPYVIRQNIPEKGSSTYHDEVFGDITVDFKDLEDNILIKTDGMPTYNFANVIDDHLMGITHCIRGVEYLMSTPKYNLLYDALGWERPVYIHLQPIMRDATHKLSKRDGDAGFEDFLRKGFLPHAIVNYIALLGWNPKDNREKLSMEELTELFSIEGLQKSSSIFDETKMRWLNSLYVKELSADEFHAAAQPFYKEYCDGLKIDYKYLSELLQPRVEILSDVKDKTAFLYSFDHSAKTPFDFALFENKKWKTDTALAKSIIDDCIAVTKAHGDNADALNAALENIAVEKNLKKGQVLWIYRIALTGAMATPGGGTEMVKLFGKPEALARLEKVKSCL